MIPNYPYFGLPNYMKYVYPNTNTYPRNTYTPSSSFSRRLETDNNYTNNSKIEHSFKHQSHTDTDSIYNHDPYIGNNSASKHHPYASTNSTSKYKPSTYINSTSKSKDNNSSQNASPLFNLFGIKLYFDDVLLICIIFFLYNENVNDPYLFFTLILLLLT